MTTRTVARVATAIAFSPVIFTGGVLLAATQYDGYSHATQKISELGGVEATSPWIQNGNFIILGSLILALAWVMLRALDVPRAAALLLGYFGVVVIAHAFLPCDVGCAGSTTVGLIHNATGLTAFVSAIVAMHVLAGRWENSADWAEHGALTRTARTIAIIGLVWFVVTQAADLNSAGAGIAQRVFAGTLVTWVGVTGWRIRSLAERSRTGERTAVLTSPS